MSDPTKALDVEDERATEKQYAEQLRRRASQPLGFDGPRSAGWTHTGLPKRRAVSEARLLGRVALVCTNDILDGNSEFYIGGDPAVVNEINVFSWKAPIACTFYRGTTHHELCDQVAVVRAFRHQDGQIVDFVDEVLRADGAAPFRKRGLTVPPPPTAPKLPVIKADSTPSAETPPVDESNARPSPQGGDLPPVRAEALLRDQLLAPRTTSLTPVLSTLQPDQYDLVTMTGKSSVIIEGHPGTGKTIVATHRAAYLIHDGIPVEKRLTGNILVVGPTPGYSRHVRGVINRLAGPNDRIAVFSLPELADLIIGASKAPPISVSRSHFDVGWEVARFARLAIANFEADAGRKPLPAEVIDVLRVRAGMLTRDKEWAAYLRGLPQYKEAMEMRVYSPLIAFIHWELHKPEAFARVEHVIVDEAQDVTPLEWLLLDEINEGDTWTLLGDLNQRRSDHTLPDWNQVLDHIAIEPGTPVRRMRRGYRSTKPILEFANRLLPLSERRINAFQEGGPEPLVTPMPKKDVGDYAARQVERLMAKYPKGTVAVICQLPRSVTLSLRKRGWSSDSAGGESWSLDGKEIRVLAPDAARGLEFDAVVVVEPSEFPKNFGRHGPLYTALTRANRELVIVHSGKLPEELRRASRRS